MQLMPDPAVHTDNESFQFQKDFMYVYCARQSQGNTTVGDLGPYGFLPVVGEVGRYIAAGGCLTKITILRPSEDIEQTRTHGSECI